jgi:hypothetical protein
MRRTNSCANGMRLFATTESIEPMGLLEYIANRAGRRRAETICRLAMANPRNGSSRREQAIVQLVGDVEHPEFRDAVALVRSSARVVDAEGASPELIVVAQSRPQTVRLAEVERLRRRYPLAGVVALLGTWCEGETRTGRPWPGILRLYWYEFPAWFGRQLKLRAAGRCPDWSQCDVGFRIADFPPRRMNSLQIAGRVSRGVIQLSAAGRETADALSDALGLAGYATVWQRAGDSAPFVRGAVAGVWDGGQLDEREAEELTAFCRRLERTHTPVLAILDFPRRHRVEVALECGAAAVLGKPWRVDDLLGMIEQNQRAGARPDGHSNNRAA